jgi:hypothetical protein
MQALDEALKTERLGGPPCDLLGVLGAPLKKEEDVAPVQKEDYRHGGALLGS